MKPLKSTTLAMLLGVVLVASAAATAQTTAQADQNKKADACCSMESCCCCNGDSCPMKEAGAAQPDAKHSCCSGDSCDVKMMKADATMKHDMKHGAKGDCCKMKQKTKKKAA